jgi:hypothetical protein
MKKSTAAFSFSAFFMLVGFIEIIAGAVSERWFVTINGIVLLFLIGPWLLHSANTLRNAGR